MTFATVRTDSLRAGPLREEHAEDAARLSADASWNQTADDWRLLIRHGHGWGRFTQIGQLVATTLLLPYAQRIAWLGMVLVAERHRHQGVASALNDLGIRPEGLDEDYGLSYVRALAEIEAQADPSRSDTVGDSTPRSSFG